jgi:hypothetical protein
LSVNEVKDVKGDIPTVAKEAEDETEDDARWVQGK